VLDDDDESLPPEGFDHGAVGPDVPSVDGPEVETTDLDEVDPDPETARLFWRLVLVFDVALFALVAGPVLWYFEGRRALGLQVAALGVVTFTYGVYRLRTRETGGDQ
jgi:hypothetical protein